MRKANHEKRGKNFHTQLCSRGTKFAAGGLGASQGSHNSNLFKSSLVNIGLFWDHAFFLSTWFYENHPVQPNEKFTTLTSWDEFCQVLPPPPPPPLCILRSQGICLDSMTPLVKKKGRNPPIGRKISSPCLITSFPFWGTDTHQSGIQPWNLSHAASLYFALHFANLTFVWLHKVTASKAFCPGFEDNLYTTSTVFSSFITLNYVGFWFGMLQRLDVFLLFSFTMVHYLYFPQKTQILRWNSRFFKIKDSIYILM